MIPSIEHIVFFDDLSVEQRRALKQAASDDAEVRSLLHMWTDVRTLLAERMMADVVDRECFALYVLSEFGRSDALTPAERQRVEEAAPLIRGALQRRQGLSLAAGRVVSDAHAFDAQWAAHFDDMALSSGTESKRLHRPAMPRGRARRSSRARSRFARGGVRVAIAAAVVVFAVLLTIVGRRDLAYETIATGPQEVRVVEFGDGSTVRVLGNSSLSYVPPGEASVVGRQAEFEGRGFFDIAPGDRGFVLKTPNAQAVVLGTSFGVRTEGDRTEVVLNDGRLTLSPLQAPEQAVVLSPGQMSRVDAGQRPSAPEDVLVHEQLAWTGLFVFRAAEVRDILTTLSDQFGTPVTSDERLLGEEVTGRFDRSQPLDEILRVVAAAVDAHVVEDADGGYHLAGN